MNTKTHIEELRKKYDVNSMTPGEILGLKDEFNAEIPVVYMINLLCLKGLSEEEIIALFPPDKGTRLIKRTVKSFKSIMGAGTISEDVDEVPENLMMKIHQSIRVPSVLSDNFFIKPSTYYRMCRFVIRRIPFVNVGPTGTGKTTAMRLLAKSFDLELIRIDCGTIINPEAAFSGTKNIVIDPETRQAITEFVPSEIAEAIQRPCLLYLDEFNRTPPEAMNYIMSLLDDDAYLPSPNNPDITKRRIKKHPGCVIAATMNEGVKYTGTFSLDDAHRRRLKPVKFEYPTEDEDTDILKNVVGVRPSDAKAIASFGSKVRAMVGKRQLNFLFDTSMLLETGTMVIDGHDVTSALTEICVHGSAPGELETLKTLITSVSS